MPDLVCAVVAVKITSASAPVTTQPVNAAARMTAATFAAVSCVVVTATVKATAFKVMGAYIAVLLVRPPPPRIVEEFAVSVVSKRAIMRALWPFVNPNMVVHDRTPLQVPLTHFYPFTAANRTGLHNHFLDTVSQMQPNSAVAFHAGHGTDAKADYWYIIRGENDGEKRRFHVLGGDSKHTIQGSGVVSVTAAEQVRQAKQSLLNLWPARAPSDAVTTTLFVISPAATSQPGWPDEVALLNAETLAFLPWTLFLFRGIPAT